MVTCTRLNVPLEINARLVINLTKVTLVHKALILINYQILLSIMTLFNSHCYTAGVTESR